MRFVTAQHQCILPPSGLFSSADQCSMLPSCQHTLMVSGCPRNAQLDAGVGTFSGFEVFEPPARYAPEGTKLAARLSTLVTSVSSTRRSNREDQVQGHAERRWRMCTFLTTFLGFYLLHHLVCYNVRRHAIVVTQAVRSLPSSSIAC